MASSGKFDLSTVSPDRPLYTSAQRGSYTTASLDRSSSFRDSMENPILSSLPSMSRSTSSVTQVDVTNFLQCLRFDPKSMAADHKFNRHGDFRRLASAVLGSPDESPSSKGKLPNSSPDDLKRLKAGLRESTIKARERVKIFSETLSVVNKCFPSIPSRKRSRGPDGLPGDRSTGLLLNRAAIGTPKIGGAQSHSLTSAFDFDQQKVEERGKSVIPNKRTRTSMEVRPNTPARSSGNVDRDKEPLRIPTSNEDRALPIVADGWEKAKMKKKRTGIKVDASPSPSSGSTKPIDGYREPKQGMHSRHVPDGIARLNDSHGFRPGAANGVVGGGKSDGPTMGMRPSIPRPDTENTSLIQRDRSTSSEKERAKRSIPREEFVSGSPTSTTKLHTNARGPRSGSNVAPKSSAGQRATPDWELTHATPVTNKNPGQFGSGNRKRTPATRSCSPPVTQWADRRPQKMSRTARRTNLLPILPSSDEAGPGLDTSDVTGGSPSGPGFAKRFANSPQQQFKSKGDHNFASSTLSESEESGAVEIRSRDNHNNNNNSNSNNKGKKCDEEGKSEQNVHKMSTLVLPTRKNKTVNGEDIGDGVRRQGRTGRGFGSVRAGAPHAVEKIRNVGTAKQLRTARVGFDKSESRSGRPPTRKLSDRKAYTRQKHTAINSAADFLVGSDDGHEELLAAANAVINPKHALSSPFWRQMEPLFGFVSDMDMSYLKQQGSIQAAVIDTPQTLANGTESRSIEPSPEHFASPGEIQIPLCQRLLAALISEEDDHNYNNNNNNNVYGSGFEFEADMESNAFNHRSGFSGHRMNNHVMSGFDHSYNGLIPDLPMTPGTSFSEYQYGNMSLNERLLIEIQSIGIYPELVPDLPNGNEGISAEISRLEEKHHEQVSKKKSLLDNLLEFSNEARELQENREFEQHCLDKLIAMAYQKYMSCWGPHGPGGKGVGGKMAKQAALGFVRRTLDRCHEFESTGKSCFNEPLYKEMFHNGSSLINDTQIDNNEFDKVYSGTQVASPSLNNHDIYSDTFHIPDQTIGKDDVWSSRVKKRELYLDDVVAGPSSGIPSGFGATILNSAKGKRSERDREGKGSAVISRNGPPKIGRPASVKGERKTKTKLKQKTTQLSASVNGPIGRTNLPLVVKSESKVVKEKEEYCEEPLDFSHLPLPEMDVLGVGDDLGEQGQDIGSWLNIDDDILQDDDFLGLEIPMDDLSDLNMMV